MLACCFIVEVHPDIVSNGSDVFLWNHVSGSRVLLQLHVRGRRRRASGAVMFAPRREFAASIPYEICTML